VANDRYAASSSSDGSAACQAAASSEPVALRESDPISEVMQHLDLSDEEAAALIKELADITRNDRYPFSSRIPDSEGDPGEAATETGPRAPAAEGVRSAASNGRQEAPHRPVALAHFSIRPRTPTFGQ
jgi:hypothetical protein